LSWLLYIEVNLHPNFPYSFLSNLIVNYDLPNQLVQRDHIQYCYISFVAELSVCEALCRFGFVWIVLSPF
jgi:hypothetical protein